MSELAFRKMVPTIIKIPRFFFLHESINDELIMYFVNLEYEFINFWQFSCVIFYAFAGIQRKVG